jgi:hypothetical protein
MVNATSTGQIRKLGDAQESFGEFEPFIEPTEEGFWRQ